MRIALYTSKMNDGGVERTMANIANYMVSCGHEVLVVTTYLNDDEYELDNRIKRIISEPSKELLTGNRIHNFVTRFTTLRNIWKAEKPDVIFSYLGKNNLMAVATSRWLNIPTGVGVVATPSEEYYTPILAFLAKFLFRFAAGIVLQTKESKGFFPNAVLKKAVILKNPTSEEFDMARYEGEREKVIVSVGRVDANKNHELIIDAFGNIARDYPDYKLVIYGDGELRQSLINKVERMGLSAQIELPGRINNVADTIKKATVFVLSSQTEGSPNVLIEAMMLGLPVISTDCPCGGPAELITNGVNGVLTPVNDVEKMQDNLQKILSDLQFAERIGRAASSTRAIYSPKIVLNEWKQFLEGLVNTEKGKNSGRFFTKK